MCGKICRFISDHRDIKLTSEHSQLNSVVDVNTSDRNVQYKMFTTLLEV